jgi:hypothetical protein
MQIDTIHVERSIRLIRGDKVILDQVLSGRNRDISLK